MISNKKPIKFITLIKIPLILLCLVALGIAIYQIFIWQDDSKQIDSQIEEISKIVTPYELTSTDNSTLVNPPEDKENPYWDFIKLSMMNVDFAKLKDINNETKGWIQVLGTNINYPFVQHNDNKFYLNHSFDQKENGAGWVFLDSRNNIDNIDRNNIIYAHGRINSVLFGTLKNILKSGWLETPNNHVIKVATESGSSIWQVFSVYHTPTTSDYIVTDFKNDETYLNFLKYLEGKSAYDFNVEVDSDDKILTLSTCFTSTEKVVMHAKLIKVVSKN